LTGSGVNEPSPVYQPLVLLVVVRWMTQYRNEAVTADRRDSAVGGRGRSGRLAGPGSWCVPVELASS
jgi:hypothetical protein